MRQLQYNNNTIFLLSFNPQSQLQLNELAYRMIWFVYYCCSADASPGIPF